MPHLYQDVKVETLKNTYAFTEFFISFSTIILPEIDKLKSFLAQISPTMHLLVSNVGTTVALFQSFGISL